MLPVISIGPLAVPAAPLIMLVGLWVGLALAERHAPHFGIDPEQFYRLSLVAMIAGVISARAGYVAQNPAPFLANPLQLLIPRPEMLHPWAGWIGALVGALVYAQWKKMPLWATADTTVSVLAALAVTGGLAHLASGTAFGMPTDAPWAIPLWGANRHPTQIYAMVAALLAAAATWPRRKWTQAKAGLRWWLFLALSAAGRLFIEGFRGDSILIWDVYRQAQVLAWLVLAASLWQIGRRWADRAVNLPLQPQ